MLGEKLVALRKKYGYSQQELADKMLVTRQTISNWECGQGSPSLDKAIELSEIYRISLDDLVSNQVELIVREKRKTEKRLLKCLEGKCVKLSYANTDLWFESGFELGGSPKAKILEVCDEWLRIEYTRTKESNPFKKERVVKLLDINIIDGFEILEENL